MSGDIFLKYCNMYFVRIEIEGVFGVGSSWSKLLLWRVFFVVKWMNVLL